jgi:RHS repeat-associated protein
MREIYLFALLIVFNIITVTAQNVDYSTPLYTNTTFSKVIDTSLPVGSIKASGSVSSGGATYSVPIGLPPGTNGIAPNLSLEYNSMGANDFLGSGWSMSGLSSIDRSGQNLYYDGKVTPVDLSGNDRFTLDGQRLIGVTGTYGANTATYASESESFAIITSYGTAGTGPAYFKAVSKDGTEMEFGNTSDSRITDQSNNNVLFWRLSKIKYPDGNYITFKYTFDAASDRDSRIDEINYTGNDAAGIIPYNKIKFSYKVRADITTQYVAGSSLLNKYLLDKITITSETANVQTYEVKYGWDGVNSYLREIVESGNDGTKLNSTRFKYGDIPTELTVGSTTIPSGNGIQSFTGDYNGDGSMDLLTATTDHSDTYGFDYINQFKTWKRDPSTGSYSLLATQNLPTTSSFVIQNKPIPTTKGPSPLDVNGDGVDDVVVLGIQYVPSGGGFNRLNEIAHYESNSSGTGFTEHTQSYPLKGGIAYSKIPTNGQFFFQGDFDGDGITEYVVMLGNESNSNYGIFFYDNAAGQANAFTEVIQFPTSSTATRTDWYTAKVSQVMDFNGDGKSDLMLIWDTGAEIFSFDSPGVARSIYQSATFPSASQFLYYGDFNADGKTDMVSASLDFSSITKAVSTGTGFSQSALTLTQPWPSNPTTIGSGNNELIIGDYNGDGKSDLYYSWLRVINYPTSSGNEQHTFYGTDLYFSQGDTFKYKQLSYLEEVQGSSAGAPTLAPPIVDAPADLNGDGRTDLVSSGGTTLSFKLFNKDGKDNYLQKVSNGFNHITEWSYKSLTSGGSFYSKGSGVSSYPLNVLQPALNLVSELKADNGIGGVSTVQYAYEGARFHRGGKGFLGLGKVTASDLTSGITSVSENEFNTTYFAAAPKKNSTYLTSGSGNVLLTETTTVNEFVAQGAAGSKRYLYRLKSSTETNVFEDRTASVINNTFDAFGNVTQSTTNNNNVETTVTNAVYGAYVTSMANKPTSVTTVKTRSGQPAFTVQTTFGYNAIGQMTSEISFANTSKPVTTTYGYNNRGNLTTTTVAPTGMPSRSSTNTYDDNGRYVISTSNVLSQTSSATFDAKWGKPTLITGLDGIKTTFLYDGYGREISTTFQATTANAFTVGQVYKWSLDGNRIWYAETTHPGKPETKTWFDLLGRQVRTETDGLSGTVIQTQTYDEKGNLKTSTEPYRAGENYITTINTYGDAYNRLTSVNLRNSSNDDLGTTSLSYNYSGGNFTLTTTTPSGASSKTTDATGQVTSATDNGGTLTYTYFSHGGLNRVQKDNVTLTTSEYDAQARQIKLTDANAGVTTYDYDALGQLTSQVDANGNTHAMAYNLLGQVTSRTGPDGPNPTTYTYCTNNTGGESKNQIKLVTGFVVGNQTSYEYDDWGRVVKSTERIDGTDHISEFTYNRFGDILATKYPSALVITNEYEATDGYLQKIKNGSVTLYSTITVNGRGNVTTYSKDNGKTSNITYVNGFPTKFETTDGIQNLNMVWDYQKGNLTSRNDARTAVNKTESFTYDNLNRLTGSTINGVTGSFSTTYTSNGNIATKTDAGSYSYHATKFNAVTGVTNPSPTGIPLIQQDITYTAFMQPGTIKENNSSGVPQELTYTYGADYERIKGELKQNGTVISTRFYFAGGFEKDVIGATTRYIQYIASPAGLAAIVESNGGAHTVHYTYTDHLGSIVTVTNSSGTVEAEQSFDAWGRRRNVTSWVLMPPTVATGLPVWLYRGYTGHEHLDRFGLINMNGRMYDPVVGRMLSPDNYIQEPGMTQSFNRYSYAMNNPMVNTDPDGHFWNFVIGAVVGGFSGYKVGKASGAHGWGLLGFTLGGAALGAFTAGVGEGAIAAFGAAGSGVTTASIGAYAAAGAITGAVSGASFAALAGGGAGDMGKAALWGGAVGGATGALSGYMRHVQFENSLSNSNNWLAGGEDFTKMFPKQTGIWLDEAYVKRMPEIHYPTPRMIYGTPGPIMDLLSGVGATSGAVKVAQHLHHSFPKFLGGLRNQKLTQMGIDAHKALHKEMNAFLKEYGMAPSRSNPGRFIRRDYSPLQIQKALTDFYKGTGAKYVDAAEDFFKQIGF